MIKEIKRTSQFKKDYKKAIKSGCKEEDFREVLEYLVAQKPLPEKYREHLVTIEHDSWISYSYVPVFDSDTQAGWDKELKDYIDRKQAWCDEHGCE